MNPTHVHLHLPRPEALTLIRALRDASAQSRLYAERIAPSRPAGATIAEDLACDYEALASFITECLASPETSHELPTHPTG